MAKYHYCYGIVKDENWMEHECELRDDCIYYDIENMRRYWCNSDYSMFYPPIGKCPHFVARVKLGKEKDDFVSPFD